MTLLNEMSMTLEKRSSDIGNSRTTVVIASALNFFRSRNHCVNIGFIRHNYDDHHYLAVHVKRVEVMQALLLSILVLSCSRIYYLARSGSLPNFVKAF